MQSRNGVSGLTGQGGYKGMEGRSAVGGLAKHNKEELDNTSGADGSRELEEMGPGNLTETLEEESLRTGPELLKIRTGLAKTTGV